MPPRKKRKVGEERLGEEDCSTTDSDSEEYQEFIEDFEDYEYSDEDPKIQAEVSDLISQQLGHQSDEDESEDIQPDSQTTQPQPLQDYWKLTVV